MRAGIGRKFQTPSIYESLTVFENLEMSFPSGRSVFGSLGFRRTPEVVEFSMVSVIGCWSEATRAPAPGVKRAGAVMFTPAIGPATVGLSGLELLLLTHPAAPAATTTLKILIILFIPSPEPRRSAPSAT